MSCAHQGTATPTAACPRVKVGGSPAVVLLSAPWTIAGCPFPPPNAGNGPCVTGTFTSGTMRVTSMQAAAGHPGGAGHVRAHGRAAARDRRPRPGCVPHEQRAVPAAGLGPAPRRLPAAPRPARPHGPRRRRGLPARASSSRCSSPRPGERVNRPDFGSGVARLVFAPSGDALAQSTQALVHGALQQLARRAHPRRERARDRGRRAARGRRRLPAAARDEPRPAAPAQRDRHRRAGRSRGYAVTPPDARPLRRGHRPRGPPGPRARRRRPRRHRLRRGALQPRGQPR